MERLFRVRLGLRQIGSTVPTYQTFKNRILFLHTNKTLPDGDMVDGAGAKLAVEFLGAQGAQVVNVVGPQMQNIIPEGHRVSR